MKYNLHEAKQQVSWETPTVLLQSCCSVLVTVLTLFKEDPKKLPPYWLAVYFAVKCFDPVEHKLDFNTVFLMTS